MILSCELFVVLLTTAVEHSASFNTLTYFPFTNPSFTDIFLLFCLPSTVQQASLITGLLCVYTSTQQCPHLYLRKESYFDLVSNHSHSLFVLSNPKNYKSSVSSAYVQYSTPNKSSLMVPLFHEDSLGPCGLSLHKQNSSIIIITVIL